MELGYKQIKQLIEALESSELDRLYLKVGESEIELEKGGKGVAAAPVPTMVQPIAEAAALAAAPAAAPAAPAAPGGHQITSPMVGTYYDAPSPDAAAFVKVGDHVSEDTVVCIVEAMKVMNEVKAGVKGTVKAIHFQSGHPVEYGANLMTVE